MSPPHRLLWLSINASHSHSSLALPLLERACAARGMNLLWHEVDCTTAAAVPPLVAEIVAFQPHFLVATCYLFNRDILLRICRRVKALLPKTMVILGGPEFLGDNGDFIAREAYVDAVLRGEGEIVFPELLVRLQSGMNPIGLPGLCLRGPDGTVFDPAESAPAPSFSAIPRAVESPFYKFDRPFAQVESSRGCRQRCTFCTSGGTPERNGTVARLVADIATVVGRGVREIRLLDRTFNASPKRSVDVLDRFREKFPAVRFHLELHPAFLTGVLRARLAAAPAGQLHIEAGLQTGESGALSATRRGNDAEAAWDGLAFLARCDNLIVHVDLLAGLPRQTFASLLADTVRLMRLGVDEIQLESVKVLPGTPLARAGRGSGLIHAPDPPYEVLASETMTVAEMEKARKLSIVIDRFYNPLSTRKAFRAAVKSHGDALPMDFTAFLAGKVDFQQPMSLANRIKLLHDFALSVDDLSLRQAAQYAWLANGLSPQHGLCQAKPWKGPPPDSSTFELIEGEIPATPGKCWLAAIGDEKLLFVCGHQAAKTPPAAVLKLQAG